MSRFNAFKLLRDLWRETQAFGTPELARLKRETLEIQQQIKELKHIRSERQRREEILALAELRASIDALSQVDASNREQAEKIKQLCDIMGDRAEAAQEIKLHAEINEATERVLGGLSMDDLQSISGGSGGSSDSEGKVAEAVLAGLHTPGVSERSEGSAQEGGKVAVKTVKKLKTAGGAAKVS